MRPPGCALSKRAASALRRRLSRGPQRLTRRANRGYRTERVGDDPGDGDEEETDRDPHPFARNGGDQPRIRGPGDGAERGLAANDRHEEAGARPQRVGQHVGAGAEEAAEDEEPGVDAPGGGRGEAGPGAVADGPEADAEHRAAEDHADMRGLDRQMRRIDKTREEPGEGQHRAQADGEDDRLHQAQLAQAEHADDLAGIAGADTIENEAERTAEEKGEHQDHGSGPPAVERERDRDGGRERCEGEEEAGHRGLHHAAHHVTGGAAPGEPCAVEHHDAGAEGGAPASRGRIAEVRAPDRRHLSLAPRNAATEERGEKRPGDDGENEEGAVGQRLSRRGGIPAAAFGEVGVGAGVSGRGVWARGDEAAVDRVPSDRIGDDELRRDAHGLDEQHRGKEDEAEQDPAGFP